MSLVTPRERAVSWFAHYQAAAAYLGSAEGAVLAETAVAESTSGYYRTASSPPSETGIATSAADFFGTSGPEGIVFASTAIEGILLGWALDWDPAHQVLASNIGLGIASTHPVSAIVDSLSSRLIKLAIDAEDEGIAISDESRRDLLRFLATRRSFREPSLFLLPNGNYRAMWWNDRKEQLGLQFLGDGEIQYVIFKEREGVPGAFRRAYGRDETRHLEALIRAMDVGALVRR